MESPSGVVRTACAIQIEGRRGGREEKLRWKKEFFNLRRKTALSGSSRQLTLKKEAPGDQV